MEPIKEESEFEQGRNLILQEKYDEALNYFKNLSEKDESNAIYHNYIGIIYFLQEEHKKASEYFKKAIEIDPNNWYSYHKLGQICSVKKIDECAIKYYIETIERHPKNINALLNLAIIFQKENKEVTLDLINSALNVEPLNHLANYMRGVMYLNEKDYPSAQKLLENVTVKKPDFFMGWYKLGMSYFRMGKFKKAIETLSKALIISRKSKILNILGLIHLYQVKLEKAVKYFEEAIKLDPEDPSPWINLSDAYIKADKNESARLCLKEAQKLVKSKNQELVIWVNYANSYEKEEKIQDALYCLERARECGVEGIESKLEVFDEEESKMELIHSLSQKIEALKGKGIKAKMPKDLEIDSEGIKSKK